MPRKFVAAHSLYVVNRVTARLVLPVGIRNGPMAQSAGQASAGEYRLLERTSMY